MDENTDLISILISLAVLHRSPLIFLLNHDLNFCSIAPPHQAWERLEKAEHERGVSLRKELIRQEKLELLAQRFDHKTTMRQAWLNENQRLVSQVDESQGCHITPSNWKLGKQSTQESIFSLPPG